MKTAVAVSGGIDSLYALIKLQEQGHDVFALHARFIETEHDVVPQLRKACEILNIPFHCIDLKKAFNKEVISPFFDYYKNARTPNPCAFCNKSMKFGELLQKAKEFGAEKLATGHYVKLSLFENSLTQDYGYSIQCADDEKKDQSYFLALTPIENLRTALFPLADKRKEDIKKEILEKNIAVPCPKESQEVCFVPHDDYRSFLTACGQEFGFDMQGSGDIFYLDSKTGETKKIARHKGLWSYTEGQRKGLGIAWSEPLYVIKRDMRTNVLYVGSKEAVQTKSAAANTINFLVPPYLWSGQLYARTRFREKQSACKVYLQNIKEKLEILIQNPENTRAIIDNIHILQDEKTRLFIEFAEDKQIYAPGQVLAVYDESGFLLAGGILI